MCYEITADFFVESGVELCGLCDWLPRRHAVNVTPKPAICLRALKIHPQKGTGRIKGQNRNPTTS